MKFTSLNQIRQHIAHNGRESMPLDQRAAWAMHIAELCDSHHGATSWIIDLGLALDYPEAEMLIHEAKTPAI
tara:strand:+ start:63418 stop:63633 length:216 start_codon:yes stop_codon:yes gene_type:complete